MAGKKPPSIDELQRAATSIRKTTTPDRIHERLGAVVDQYDAVNYQLHYGWPFWRVRKCQSRRGFGSLSEIHYPPNPSVGRVNEQGAPMLYLSFNKFTAVQEVGAEEGDYLHLVGYRQRDGQTLRCCTVGEINNVHKSGRAITSHELGEELNKVLNRLSYAGGASFVFLDAFLASLLTDVHASKNEYIYSRTLAKLLFAGNPGYEAIHYPSVALHGSMNLAVRPDIADEMLESAGTSVIRINRVYDYGIYDFSVVRNAKGHYADGAIDWEPR